MVVLSNKAPTISGSYVSKFLKLILKQKPEKADAIVWLQGDRFDRGKKVAELFYHKFSKKILILGNNILVGPNMRRDENDIEVNKLKSWLIKKKVSEKNILLENTSLNTRQQAINLAKYTKKKSWKKILLVTSPYHQLRAFLTCLKAFEEKKIKTKIINQPALDLSWEKIASGRKLPGRKLLIIELNKINRYKKDLVSMRRAFKYLSKYENHTIG